MLQYRVKNEWVRVLLVRFVFTGSALIHSKKTTSTFTLKRSITMKEKPETVAIIASFLEEVSYREMWQSGRVDVKPTILARELSLALSPHALVSWGRAFVRRKTLIVKYGDRFVLPEEPQPCSAATPLWHVEYFDARNQKVATILARELYGEVAKLSQGALEAWCKSIELHFTGLRR